MERRLRELGGTTVRHLLFASAALAASSFIFSACGDSDTSTNCKGSGPTRCIGALPPDSTTEEPDGTVTFEWNQESGPRCVRGSEFRSFLKPGPEDASTIVFYLPNDGAWLPNGGYALLAGGVAPARLAAAPATPLQQESVALFGPHHFTYVSPCDGSLYVGDRDYTTEQLVEMGARDTAPRYYRGFLNIAASMNATALRYPKPERVVVMGSGAGSLGISLASIHAAEQFPNAEILVIQDGSPGVSAGTLDLNFTSNLIDAWGAKQTFPTFCVDCLRFGHLQEMLVLAAAAYPNFRFATVAGSRESSVPTFINLPPGISTRMTAEIYECLLSKELERARIAAGGSYAYYVADGTYNRIESFPGQFDFVAETENGNAPALGDWLRSFIANDAGLTSHSEIEMGVTTDCSTL